MSENKTEREAFEAWADDQGFPLKRLETSDDDYQDLRTQGPWEAWQARAAIPQAVSAEPSDTQILECNDEPIDGMHIAAPDEDLIAFARAVLAPKEPQ